jgi:uncharacterized protein
MALRRAMRTFPAVLVTGPRQSGKTTLLRTAWSKGRRFVSLEQPAVRARALADPVGFLRDNPPPLLLDEIQYVPDLLHHLKEDIDQNRLAGRYLLAGSQSLALMQGISQSLAGRVAALTLLPFSIGEASGQRSSSLDVLVGRVFGGLGHFRPQPPRISIGNWLLRGAYPEPRANSRVDHQLWCASYIQTYLERDVRTLLKVGDLNAFSLFVRLCAARTGQILNLSDLARDAGISVPTARSWLSVLEASHEVFLLPPYFANFGKRLVKAPKLYFIDTALAAYLSGITSEAALLQGPMAGALFETAIVVAWRKALVHRGQLPNLFYWRSSDGLEIDLLLERDRRLFAIEAKLTATPTPGHAASLVKWMFLAKDMVGGAVVQANVDSPMSLVPGVKVVPWWWV